MKRLSLLLFALLLLLKLSAIVCLQADGSELNLQDRQYHLHHHSSTLDYYFYGSNEWAVRYDFRRFYPYGDGFISSMNFQVQGARLWFPFTGGEAVLSLHSDVNGQIGPEIQSITVEVNDHILEASFPQAHSSTTIWLKVNYVTNNFNRWVAASHGDGTNSYYLQKINQGSQEIWLSNSFSSQGFSAELLFGLLGDFVYETPDLRLSTFDLEGSLSPGSSAQPRFKVYNHGSSSLQNASLRLELSQPDSTQSSTINIPIPISIPAFSYMEFGQSDSWLPQIPLPDSPTQLRLQATLLSSYTENDTLLVNNKANRNYNIFSEEMPVVLLENFLRFPDTSEMSSRQAAHLSPRHHPLYYFPIMVDSLANLPSERRFNWYTLNSLPYTIASGNLRIAGMRDDYSDIFAQIATASASRHSFISSATCELDANPESERIMLDISLSNANTELYTSSSQSITNNSRFFVALAKKELIEGAEHFVLKRFIAFADTINTPLNAGQSMHKSYNFDLSGITPADLEENYRLYYWLQGNTERQIHYANYSEFSAGAFTHAEDHTQSPALKLSIWPNPLRKGQELHISAKAPAGSRLTIYNLKGQKVFTERGFKGSLTIDSHLIPASGVYILSLQTPDGHKQHKRISIIK